MTTFAHLLELGIVFSTLVGVRSWVPPHPNSTQPWESVHDTRKRLGLEFNYTPRHIHPEMCRFLTEEECENSDMGMRAQQVKQRQLQQEFNPTSGSINVLVVLVQFSDHTERELVSRNEIERVWQTSISQWINANSQGAYQIRPFVFDWVEADNTEVYYSFGRRGIVPEAQKMAWPALDALDNTIGFDWDKFDGDNDGKLDSVVIIHSGYGADTTSTDCFGRDFNDRIWPHAFTGTPDENWMSEDGRYSLGGYTIASAFSGDCGTEPNKIGLTVHEYMHTLGLQDLYDGSNDLYEAGNESPASGVGSFDIMANPYGHQGNENVPGHLSSWSKDLVGWLTPEEITQDGIYTLRAAELSTDAYKININPVGLLPEYLLIENRQPLLFDADLWTPGLAIYHIDDAAPLQERRGYPGQEGWPENGNHYQVAVLPKDGEYDLEKGNNKGDAGDMWVPGDMLGPGMDGTVYPNTDAYQGGFVIESGVQIIVLSQTGTDISFCVTGVSGDGDIEGCEVTQAPTSATTVPTVAPTQSAEIATLEPTASPTVPPSALSELPSWRPSLGPTAAANELVTDEPSVGPSVSPTNPLTMQVTEEPSRVPSLVPTNSITEVMTEAPSTTPTAVPSSIPSAGVSEAPTSVGSGEPSTVPSLTPPSAVVSEAPTGTLSEEPSTDPSLAPSAVVSGPPTGTLSGEPSTVPSWTPSAVVSGAPTGTSSEEPSVVPSWTPSETASGVPTSIISNEPSYVPSLAPSASASAVPTAGFSGEPSQIPSEFPSSTPSTGSSAEPSAELSGEPSLTPSEFPSLNPSTRTSALPSEEPSMASSGSPSRNPSVFPSSPPSISPSFRPSIAKSNAPSLSPTTALPSNLPSLVPSMLPSLDPSTGPSTVPSVNPTASPTNLPSSQPTSVPSTSPSVYPSKTPTLFPSSKPSISADPTTAPSGSPTNEPTPPYLSDFIAYNELTPAPEAEPYLYSIPRPPPNLAPVMGSGPQMVVPQSTSRQPSYLDQFGGYQPEMTRVPEPSVSAPFAGNQPEEAGITRPTRPPSYLATFGGYRPEGERPSYLAPFGTFAETNPLRERNSEATEFTENGSRGSFAGTRRRFRRSRRPNLTRRLGPAR